MKKLILGLLIASFSQSSTALADSDIMKDAHKIICDTAGSPIMLKRSKIVVDLNKHEFKIVRFDRNDDRSVNYMFSEERTDTRDYKIEDNVISTITQNSPGGCTDNWRLVDGKIVNAGGDLYRIVLDESSIRGNRINAKVKFMPCLFSHHGSVLLSGNENDGNAYYGKIQVWQPSESGSAELQMDCRFKN